MEISFIVPVYNEQAVIKKTVEKLHQFANNFKQIDNYEIVVVNDGSTDSTSAIINSLNINAIEYDQNLGKGNAVHLGLVMSKYNFKLVLDADLSVDPNELRLKWSFIKSIIEIEGSFVLYGQRIQVKKQPWHRLFAGFVYRNIVECMFHFNIRDSQCPFKIFYNIPNKFFLELKTKGFAYDVEVLIKVIKESHNIHYMDVYYWNDPDSRVTFSKSLLMLQELFEIRHRF